MSVVVINVLSVPGGDGRVLEERFAGRAGLVDKAAGFEGFELLRPVDGTDRYLVYTRWRSEEDFRAWQSSRDFAAGHARAARDRGASGRRRRPARSGSSRWCSGPRRAEAAPPPAGRAGRPIRIPDRRITRAARLLLARVRGRCPMSARNRVVAAAGVLVALFVVGAVWLAVRAMGTAPEPTVLDSVAQTSASESSAAPEETGAAATSAGVDPPRPRRTANVAGIRLDGNLSDACALVSYSDVPLPMRVDGITLATTLPGLSRDDQGGCPERDVPLCQDFVFTDDAHSCVVGVAVPADTPPGIYSVTVRLALRVECTSTESDRCKDVGQPAPTVAQPVDALFRAEGPVADLTVEEPEPTKDPEPTEDPEPTWEPSETGSPSAEPTT